MPPMHAQEPMLLRARLPAESSGYTPQELPPQPSPQSRYRGYIHDRKNQRIREALNTEGHTPSPSKSILHILIFVDFSILLHLLSHLPTEVLQPHHNTYRPQHLKNHLICSLPPIYAIERITTSSSSSYRRHTLPPGRYV